MDNKNKASISMTENRDVFDTHGEDKTQKGVWAESSSQDQKSEDSHQKLERQGTDGPLVSQRENGHRDAKLLASRWKA